MTHQVSYYVLKTTLFYTLEIRLLLLIMFVIHNTIDEQIHHLFYQHYFNELFTVKI